ncbi:hypothetical protein LWI29_036937 [Acer saccharum]|uniref:Uncharacterized protein n=1 Tax=Acer saccharum TaxID=4024 RepID=A0AA39VZB3_ACESA|nr:hypothetical protein LWI29_036937 [Acer saccharum]
MVVRPVRLIPRATFATIIDVDEQVVYEGVEVPTELLFAEEETQNSKVVAIDQGTAMVMRHVSLAPRADGSDWLRNNVFHSTCTILGKVCRFNVDGGSCENIAFADVVSKLGIKIEKHLTPYRLFWAAIDRDSPRSRSGSDPSIGVVWLHRRRALPSGDDMVAKPAANVWD